jgi:phosphatidate cytidylyltransferase
MPEGFPTVTLPTRLFSPSQAFQDPVTTATCILVAGALAASFVIIHGLRRGGRLDDALYAELRRRWTTWCVIVPVLLVPILLGALPTVLAWCTLSLFCHGEYARAAGLFRYKSLVMVNLAGIAAVNFAVLDHYYRLFVALTPLVVALLVAIAILSDHPKGYLQRVCLAVLGFSLFGCWLGHFTYFTNDAKYRPILLWILLGVECNDIFAYLSGRMFGRRKLCPNTSPNKTVEGALGALVLTTALVAAVGHFVFRGEAMDTPLLLCLLGALFSVAGQFGDLLFSSIKRDLGIKDLGVVLPGHGGLLDRFDSLILVSPIVFHFVNYVQGVGLGERTNLITGAFGNP